MAGRVISPAQPQIFNPDALEQIYAKGATGNDPTTSGINYAFLKNQQMNRGDAQQAYLKDLHMANALNAILEQQDIQAGLDKTIMTQSVEASKELGVPLDAMKGYKMLIENPARAGVDITNLSTDKIKSIIAKNQAVAAASGRSGTAAGPEISYTTTPLGTDVRTVGKKGFIPSQELLDKNRRIALEMTRRNQGQYTDDQKKQYRVSQGNRQSRSDDE